MPRRKTGKEINNTGLSNRNYRYYTKQQERSSFATWLRVLWAEVISPKEVISGPLGNIWHRCCKTHSAAKPKHILQLQKYN